MANTNRNRLKRLAGDQRGGVAIIAALAMFPLTMLAFAAVEFHRYVEVRSELQDSLDAATFAVARSAETDPDTLDAIGEAVLGAAFAGTPYVINSATFTDMNGDVTGQATITIPPVVSSLFGVAELSANATSKAARLGRKLEIALVLDNTYSMLTNNRLGITKEAAEAFVTTLSAAAGQTRVADALRLSLVPYSDSVRVGAEFRNASWMDGGGLSAIHDDLFATPANRFTLLDQMGETWAGCVESRVMPYDALDTAPNTANPDTLFVPYFAPDEPDGPSDPSPWTNTFGWTNNYLPDDITGDWATRQRNVAKYDQAAVTTEIGNGYYRGPNYACVLQPVVRLTNDTAKIIAGIRAMRATGDTYSNIGVMWGWHTLSPSAPFADGAAYESPVQKIVVLMTDGENNAWNNGSPNAGIYSGEAYIAQGRYGITSGTRDERRAALDARMVAVCDNMKARGITVYTIRVEVTSGTGQALSDCASDPSKFYNVQAAADLNAVFQRIADSLLNPRLAS